MPYGLGGIVSIGLMVFCVLDVIQTDESLMRNLNNKIIWLMLVIFLPVVGSIAWLVAGRPSKASWSAGSTRPSRTFDDGGFQPRGFEPPALDPMEHERKRQEALERYAAEKDEARRLKEEAARLAEWEDDLKRREQGLG